MKTLIKIMHYKRILYKYFISIKTITNINFVKETAKICCIAQIFTRKRSDRSRSYQRPDLRNPDTPAAHLASAT